MSQSAGLKTHYDALSRKISDRNSCRQLIDQYLPDNKCTFDGSNLQIKFSMKQTVVNMDYDEITLTIKLQTGDKVWVRYWNHEGRFWTTANHYEASFIGLLLYKI